MAVAILDIDGTLVDTNYQHALAWFRAFREHDVLLPLWRIHRHVGMGGDQLVPALTDERFDREHGERVRDAQKRMYGEMIDEVAPMEGARELISDLRRRGHKVLLASSARREEVERYRQMIDPDGLADGWTCEADVEQTKPQPDLVEVALRKAGADAKEGVMIGDSPWDARAAERAGVQTIAVMCGGFSREELLQAGAVAVYESVAQLRRALDETSLG